MVAIFTGAGLGLERGSGSVLGGMGLLGGSSLGRADEHVYLNAANGNLMITRQDEFLVGRGPDSAISRTYNSKGDLSDDNGDNWRPGTARKLTNLPGTYGQSGSTVTRVDWDGSSTVYTWNSSWAGGGAYVGTDGEGGYDTLTRSGTTWTWTDGDTQTTELYDETQGGRITASRDSDLNAISYSYNGAGLISRVATANGEYTDFVYSTQNPNQIAELATFAPGAGSTPTLTRVRYGYDTHGRLVTVTVDLTPGDNSVADGNSYVTTYTYDDKPLPNPTEFSNRVKSISQSDGSLLQIEYDEYPSAGSGDWRVKSLTETVAGSVTRATTIKYFSGQTRITDPAGGITVMSYDTSGNLLEIVHPSVAAAAPRLVRFAYNSSGDVSSTTRASGDAVAYEYDERGNRTLERDAAGNTVRRTYSASNELLTETRYLVPDPDGAGASLPSSPVTTRFAYDGESHLRFAVSAEGHVTEHVYDSAGRRTSTIEYAGSSYSIAALGEADAIAEGDLATWVANLTTKSQAKRTDFAYDARGNLTTVTSYSTLTAGGTGSASSNNGIVINGGTNTAVTATGGGVYRLVKTGTVDGYNAVAQSTTSATANFVLRLRPRQTDKRIAVGVSAAPGSGDGLSDLAFGIDFRSSGTAFYNEGASSGSLGSYTAGEDFWIVRSSGTVSYYKGRTLEEALAGTALRTVTGSTDAYYFDSAIFSAGAAADVQYMTGSGLAQVVDSTKTHYVYDQAGRLLGRRLTGEAAYEAFVYDGLGRVVASTDFNNRTTSIVFNDAATTTVMTLADGMTRTSVYDKAGELIETTETGLDATDATTLYRYDSLGRLRIITDPVGMRTFLFYDPAGCKIADVDADGSVVEYRYDANGNVTSRTGYAARLTQTQLNSLVDASGNPSSVTFDSIRPADVADNRWEWKVYDNAQRLIQTVDGTGATTVYAYDGASRLVSTRSYANRLSATAVATLKSAALAPNLWANPTDGTLWTKSNASVASAGTIDGQNAFQFTAITGGATASVFGPAKSVAAGDTLSLTFYIRAAGTGPTTVDMGGLQGNVSGYGSVGGSTATIIAGPGTLSQTSGGIWKIEGLSATEATRITITRTFSQSETVTPKIFIKSNSSSQIAAGDSVILAAPVLAKLGDYTTTLPTADAAKDRVARNFYDADGRLAATLDAEGFLTEIRYDEAGQKTKTIAYADATDEAQRASGTLAQLLASVTADPDNDIHNYFVYDARGLLRATIDGEGSVTRFRYTPLGELDQELSGYKLDPATLQATPPTFATLPAANTTNFPQSVTYTRNRYGQPLTETRYLINSATTTTVYKYDSMRRLVSKLTQSGGPDPRTHSQCYDGRGRLTSELSGDGNVALAALGANPTSAQIEAVYAQYGWNYAYDDSDRMISKTAPKGQDSAGPKTLYYYNADGALVYELNALGEVTEYAYNAFGERTDAILYGAALSPANLATLTGGLTNATVDGLVDALATAGVTEASHFDFNVDGTVKQSTDPLTYVSTFTYDAFGALITSIVPREGSQTVQTSRTYDRRGLLKTETVDSVSGGKQILTSYGYDAFGRKILLTNAENESAVTAYDRAGRVTSVTDAENQTTGYIYDNRGNLVAVTDANNKITRHVYDKDDRRIETIDALGGVVQNKYDDDGRLIETRAYINTISTGSLPLEVTALTLPTANNGADRVTRYAYDKDGQLRFVVDGLNHLVEYVNDARGNVVRTIQYAGTVAAPGDGVYSESYLAGQAASLASAASRISRGIYDPVGRLAYSIDAIGQVTAYTYDSAGRVTQQLEHATLYTGTGDPLVTAMNSWHSTNAGNADNRISYALYDAKGQLLLSVDAEKYITRHTYDALGHVRKQIRYADAYSGTLPATKSALDAAYPESSPPASARVTQFVYDTAGRLEQTIDPDGFVTKLELDQVGRITKSIAAFGTADESATQYEYDDVGRVTAETRAFGTAGAVTTSYGYDALGRMTSRIVASNIAADSAETRWEYDDVGRTKKEIRGFGTDEAATRQFGYDALGRAISETDPRTYVTSRTYDALDRLTSEKVPIDATPGDELETIYAYDDFGNAVKVIDPRGGETYSYFDKLDRVTLQADAGAYFTATSYTRGGQVAKVTRHATAYVGTLTTTTVPTPAVDSAQDAVTEFRYDKLDRLTKVIDAEGYDEVYTLNAFGERIKVRNKLGSGLVEGQSGYDSYATVYTYNKRGLVLSEMLPISSTLANGTPAAVVNKFEYDGRGNRTKSIEADGLPEKRITNFVYNKLDRLIEKSGDAVAVVGSNLLSAGIVTPKEAYDYDGRGNLTRTRFLADTKVQSQSYAYYDDLDRKTGEVSAIGTLTHWVYDGNGNVTSVKVFGDAIASPALGGPPPTPVSATNVRETSFGYDRANRQTSTSVAGLLTGEYSGSTFTTTTGAVATSTQYHDDGKLVQETDGRGNSSWTWHDKLGRRIAQVDRENYLTTWALDADGNVETEVRYASRIASAIAALTTASALAGLAGTHADDRTTSFKYDRNGRRTEEKRLGVAYATVASDGSFAAATASSVVKYEYNALGLVKRKEEARVENSTATEATDYEYDAAGRLTVTKGTSFTDHGGNSVRLAVDTRYDGLGNLTRSFAHKDGDSVEANGRVTTYVYGAGGRLTSTTDAAGFTRSFGYDAAGRVVKESYTRTKADGTTQLTEAIAYRFDEAGRLKTQATATFNGSTWTFGEATRIRYNAWGDVTGRGITATPDMAEGTFSYQETFDYDGGGRLWRSNSGDGVLRFFVHDKAGNQTLTLASSGAADLSALTVSNYTASITSTGGTSTTGAVTGIAVFDKRGQQTQTREPDRQLAAATTQTLAGSRSYNAFGEVTSETDARNFTTTYAYNNMGRLVSKVSPQVSVTAENGGVSTVSPTEYYDYDIAGRLVAVTDANGNRTKRLLLAGTGFGETEALVRKEFHPDSGVFETKYDVFGDARTLINEMNQSETRSYDKMGRLTEQTHRGLSTVTGQALTDYYDYDGLGQRIKHWNSFLAGTGSVETTDYDVQGRVTKTVAFGGDATTITYGWDGSIATAGMGTFGGWTRTTAYAHGHSLTEKTDLFARIVGKTDMGANNGRVTSFTYDRAGRLTQQQTGSSGQSQSISYFNTGRVSQVVDNAGTGLNSITATFAYDEAGNRTYEGHAGTVWTFRHYTAFGVPLTDHVSASQTLQNATFTYDALGRMTSFVDKDSAGTTRITVNTYYDANGNVRHVASSYPDLAYPTQGAESTDHWYRYDSMGRMVVAEGKLENGQIVRGSGLEVTYDFAGRRRTQTRETSFNAQVQVFVFDDPQQQQIPDEGVNGHYESWNVAYLGLRREEYDYTPDGALWHVHFAETGYTDNGDGTVTPTWTYGASKLRALYERDGMERIARYYEYDDSGAITQDRYNIVYRADGLIASESVSQKRIENGVANTYLTHTLNNYGAGGVLNWTSADNYRNGNDEGSSGMLDTRTDYTYDWWDGPQAATTSHDKDTNDSGDTPWLSSYVYDGAGRLAKVHIKDGRERTVSFASAADGQVLVRVEKVATGATDPAPVNLYYYADGRRVGDLTNNAGDPAELDFAESLAARNHPYNPQNGAFRNGTASGSTAGNFGAGGYTRINPYSDGAASTGSRYTVREGDTLQGIAQQVWGDASLWYMLAEANGLAGGAALIAGQSLIVPDRVSSIHHNAGTFEPYDPSRILGDLAPTAPKPPKKQKCGVFGAILLVAIAVAVTIVTSGAFAAVAASASTGSSFTLGAGITMALGGTATAGGVTASLTTVGMMAAGAIGGAVGSAVSQGVGVATGMQDKFSWKGVAMAGISGGIGGGLGNVIKGAGFLAGAARGAVGSALSQGIGVATGLQEKFDFAGIAAAGVAAGLSAQLGKNLPALKDNRSIANVFSHMGVSAASAIANAATRTILSGTSFRENILAALPDVIGSTIGNLLAGSLTSGGESSTEAEAQAAKGGSVSGRAGSDKPPVAVSAGGAQAPAAPDDGTGTWLDGLQELAGRLPGGGDLSLLRLPTNPRARPGGNGGPPLNDPRTLQEVARLAPDHPAGAVLGVLDNILDITGPANRAIEALYQGERRSLIAEIHEIDPSWRYTNLAEPVTREGMANDIRFLREERAVVSYRRTGDTRLLQVETLKALQRFVDVGYGEAVRRYEAGLLPPRLSREEAIGNYVDQYTRRNMQMWFNRHGISTASGQPIRVNNRAYAADGTYRVPDVRVSDIAFDPTISYKTAAAPQVRGFFNADFQPRAVVIVRPTPLGGSYIIPRPRR